MMRFLILADIAAPTTHGLARDGSVVPVIIGIALSVAAVLVGLKLVWRKKSSNPQVSPPPVVAKSN